MKKIIYIIPILLLSITGVYLYLIKINKIDTINNNGLCTLILKPGLIIYLYDENGTPINNALIKSEDGKEFNSMEGNNQYTGLYEYNGKHKFFIEKEGYQKYEGMVKLNNDACHVITQELIIKLRTNNTKK